MFGAQGSRKLPAALVYITAIHRNGSYGCVCNDVWTWKYKGKRIFDLTTLKLAAFDAFDLADVD